MPDMPDQDQDLDQSPEDIPICNCCGYEAELKEYGGPIVKGFLGGKGKSKFCYICANTFLSHYVTYPELYGEQHHLFASIGWIANYLLSEIKSLKETNPKPPTS